MALDFPQQLLVTCVLDTTDRLICPVCGGQGPFLHIVEPEIWIGEAYFAPLRGRIHVSSCRQCGLHLVTPRPDDSALAGFYSRDGYACHTVEGGSRPDVILNLVPPTLQGVSSWLDIGCGAGALIQTAKQRGWDARGVEIGEGARNRLLQQGLTVYPDLPACRQAGFRPDIVSMITVLEHIAEPGSMLEEIRSILSPGGHLLVVVPNLESLRARFGWVLPVQQFPGAQKHMAFPIHLVYYTRRHLRRLLESHGFTVTASGSHGFGLEMFDRPGAQPKAYQPTAAKGTNRNAVSRTLRSLAKRILSVTHTGEDLWMIARARPD